MSPDDDEKDVAVAGKFDREAGHGTAEHEAGGIIAGVEQKEILKSLELVPRRYSYPSIADVVAVSEVLW